MLVKNRKGIGICITHCIKIPNSFLFY